jgi:hypothetical protein
MLQRLVTSAITTILLLVFVHDTFAQGPPCKPDCPGDNWSNPVSIVTLTINGCSVDIHYRTRFACSTYHDVYIERVVANGVNCAGVVPDWSVFMHQVALALILANPMGFPPSTNGTCEDTWRISKGNCWAVDVVGGVGEFGNPQSHLAPCTSAACCLERFEVCLDANGVRRTTFQGNAPQPCPSGTPSHCFPVCNVGGR